MTNAHPMIQPSDPDLTPGNALKEMPSERARVYELVWRTTLACCLKAPRVTHARRTAEVARLDVVLAVATRQVDPNQPGWSTVRPLPPAPWPLQSGLSGLGHDAWEIVNVHPGTEDRSVATLLTDMEQTGVGTSATYAEILRALVKDHQLLAIDAVPNGVTIRPTYAGIDALKRASGRGVEPLNELAHAQCLVAEVRDGMNDVEGALDAAEQSDAQAIASHIVAIVQPWAGDSADSVWQRQRGASARVPSVALPRPLDPERLLPLDHPWRALRDQMERSLAAEPAWPLRSAPQQRAARWVWLQQHELLWPEPIGEPYHFSTLVTWLIGGPLERPKA